MSRSRSTRCLLVAAVVLMSSVWANPSFGQDESALLRQIKSDLFDRKWEAVLDNCDEFIDSFPGSSALPRAFYYRAQALEHIRGREGDAIRAYSEFIDRFPDVSETMKEDAQLSSLTLATSRWLKGDKAHVVRIMEGMQLEGYPKLYAAIQASKIDHRPARTRALPILKECSEGERDPELKNECAVAVLRIDPKSLGPGEDTGADAKARPGGNGGEVKLIRVEVFDKTKEKVIVRVNMPIAFAELVLDAIQQVWREEIERHIQAQGIGTGNLETFWKAIKEGGPQTILEIDNEGETIKLWVE